MMALATTFLSAQNRQDYYVVAKPNISLAPIQTTTNPDGTLTLDLANNNNIAWKNTTVVDIYPNTPSQIGGVVAVGNPFATVKAFNLQFVKDTNEPGQAIYDEAEVSVEMDDIAFEANEYGTAYITFNFLTAQLTSKQHYIYQVIQRDKATNKIIGGETFEINKQPRASFLANAGDDETIDRSESVTLQAEDINEAAVYNWYGPDGTLIYTGATMTVSPEITQQYKLEIISDLDGLKDYGEVTVTVNPYRIISMAPNPVSSLLTIDYMAEGVSSADIMVLNQSTGASDNYILNTTEDNITLDLTGHTTGLYSIILVCNGEIQDTKNLLKQ